MIEIFDNKINKVGNDLKLTINKGSKINVIAAIFSIYGYESLKSELNKIKELKFIFTDPTFIKVDKKKKQQRKFEINSNETQKAISGSDFEINLKNKLKGKAIAKECKTWIEKKVKFKSNKSRDYMQPNLTIEQNDKKLIYTGINQFTSAGFGYEKDNSILSHVMKTDDDNMTKEFIKSFDDIWNDEGLLQDITQEVIDYISNLYNDNKEIDVLIATDCISEGQNLQDCDTLINYDIHWNPVRIIQRFGRIDRIGSRNKDIQLVNFWPELSLDEYIKLKSRVENKMLMVDATATGEDNVLTNQSSDLIFRQKQLEKLQNEVVDIEDMDSSISITDLGLNDFRMDLVNYTKEHGSLSSVSNGMHSVCKKDISKGIEEGVIFVLKNINNGVNIDNANQLHPFYMIYIKENGEIISNHLNVKRTLDILRVISKGNTEAIKEVYELFNEETEDGKKMDKYSKLLNNSIKSILNIKEESDIDSLFSIGGTTALINEVKGLEDFELITFIIIK